MSFSDPGIELQRIVAIVEGHGEVTALPILLRRIGEALEPARYVEVPKPIRVKRQKVLKEGELERAVRLAILQTRSSDGILILLDADSDCPKELASEIHARSTSVREDRRIRVVLAKVEYEAWFLASARSLGGERGLDQDLAPPPDPEAIRNPKGWLSKRMPVNKAYRETLDQPALTASLDLDAARSSPSFDKLWRDVESLLTT